MRFFKVPDVLNHCFGFTVLGDDHGGGFSATSRSTLAALDLR